MKKKYSSKTNKRWLKLAIFSLFVTALLGGSALMAETKIPTLAISIGESQGAGGLVPALKILAIMTILAVAPALLLMTTAFTRIIIVLSFIRQALGTQTMPPNQVLLGLALFLTLFTMTPVFDRIQEKALTPYMAEQIDDKKALEEAIIPVRKFMLAQTREEDLSMLINLSHKPRPEKAEDLAMTIIMPAFLLSELRTAFQIGFIIYIPFLVIDMVVSSVLMAMGMLMLPPTVISLPFKIILFVLVDGWSLIIEQIVSSFRMI